MTQDNNISLEDAMRILRDHYGSRLEAGRDEGRSIMADALAEHLNISKGDASQTVEVLERARTIEWIERGGLPDVALGIPSTGQGVPIPIAGNDAYWRLGSEAE